MITEDMKWCMHGTIPSIIASCDADGIPNVTPMSQTFYVDSEHIAISHQFFNKTMRNIQVNPGVCIVIQHPGKAIYWLLHSNYLRSETGGDLFDRMNMQLEAIASMMGMEGVFQLKAAEIFKVNSVEMRSFI